MSTKQEYHGLRQFRPQYELLKNIDKQTCMMQNNVYRSFNNGRNCLCVPEDRTVMDKAMMQKNYTGWPLSNSRLGWKL